MRSIQQQLTQSSFIAVLSILSSIVVSSSSLGDELKVGDKVVGLTPALYMGTNGGATLFKPESDDIDVELTVVEKGDIYTKLQIFVPANEDKNQKEIRFEGWARNGVIARPEEADDAKIDIRRKVFKKDELSTYASKLWLDAQLSATQDAILAPMQTSDRMYSDRAIQARSYAMATKGFWSDADEKALAKQLGVNLDAQNMSATALAWKKLRSSKQLILLHANVISGSEMHEITSAFGEAGLPQAGPK